MEFSAFTSQLSVLNTAGWEDTVLWNPYGNEGMGYNNFVCVESVKVSLRFLVARFVNLRVFTNLRESFMLCNSLTRFLLALVNHGKESWH